MPKPSEIRQQRERAERRINAALHDHLSQLGLPYDPPAAKETVRFVLTTLDPHVTSALGLLRWAIGRLEDDIYTPEDVALLELAKALTEGVPEAGV